MRNGTNAGPESPSNRQNDAVEEHPVFLPTSGGDFDGRLGVGPIDGAVETRVSDITTESLNLLENEEIRQREEGALDKTESLAGRSENEKVKNSVEDYDSMLSEFDQFASKGAAEAVGYGYEIGDMVWGKVKSHPWWPGRIYNEEFASPSVRRSKREGHALVAFFGDSSYGWFDPAELVPFEESFAEKSRQMSSRGFVKAVEEAVDELSRRRSSVLACRCRNEFNFWPASVEGYYVVDVGDYEPGIYSSSQISKARESFRPNEMLLFVQQLALTPKVGQHRTIEFIKNKATVLACRKAMYEEFDDTYAEAFGTAPVRPSRPTAPMSVDPSKAPLSGRLVIAEALGKGKLSVKSTSKPKEQAEKDKYLFKRRDEQIHMKSKKTSSGQVGPSTHPLFLDGSGLSGIPTDSSIKGHTCQTSVSGITDGQQQPSSDQASVVSSIKPSEGSRKLVQGGKKKAQVSKRNAGVMSAENATLIVKKKRKKELQAAGELSPENVIRVNKKRKKEMKSVVSAADTVQLPLSNGDSGEALEKVSGMLLDVPVSVPANQVDDEKTKDGEAPSSSSQVETQALDVGKVELSMLLRNLRALALNPFHGAEMSCPKNSRLVFLKYRSLVYQKSLVLFPATENETKEAYSRSHASTVSRGPADKTTDKSTIKLMKPSVRPVDPTKGGMKRLPSDRPEGPKKKRKLVKSKDMNRMKKPVVSEDMNKKIIVEPKIEKKATLQRPTESQRGPAKQIAVKNASPTLQKPVKLAESIKRNERRPTMLVMKFPAGAALPSGAELRAKFARFGQLDHSATRVFWKSYTCRLVYQQKAHAQAALEFAVGSGNLFGNTNVRCHIREVEGAEPEPPVVNKVDNVPAGEQRIVVPPAQLKSCLKKLSGEEGGGNGNGRGTSTRVKFNILGGEGGGTSNNNTEGQVSTSFPEGAYTSYTHSMDVGTSKNLPNFIPELAPLPTNQFRKDPINMPTTTTVELPPRSFNARPTQQMPSSSAPANDISKQLLNLLTRCSDVVNNLTGVFGYVPYHSL